MGISNVSCIDRFQLAAERTLGSFLQALGPDLSPVQAEKAETAWLESMAVTEWSFEQGVDTFMRRVTIRAASLLAAAPSDSGMKIEVA